MDGNDMNDNNTINNSFLTKKSRIINLAFDCFFLLFFFS